jgi:hypothetical protein
MVEFLTTILFSRLTIVKLTLFWLLIQAYTKVLLERSGLNPQVTIPWVSPGSSGTE